MESFPTSPEPHTQGLKDRIGKALRKVGVIAGLIAGTTGMASAQHSNEGRATHHTSTESITPVRKATPEEMAAARKYYLKERDWLINVIKSPEYKRRLIENEKLPEDAAQRRIDNILSTPMKISKEMVPYLETDANDRKGMVLMGGYVHPTGTNDKEVDLPPTGYDSRENFGTAVHEYNHAATDADIDMSNYAYNLYQKAFTYTNDEKSVIEDLREMEGIENDPKNPKIFTLAKDAPLKTQEAYEDYLKNIAYFNDPTELDARKKVLEYEMEKLGIIKKYGQKFTQKDIDMLYEKYDTLSQNTQQFLDHINEKYLIEIMNTLAKVDIPTTHEFDHSA